VRLNEGETLRVNFYLKPTVTQTREVTIKAERPLVDVKRASTIRSFDQDELKSMALQPTLDSVVEQQPGVTKDNDQIHVRGGRADETLFIVDGVRTRDLLSGDSKGSTISARSVAEVNIITGGFDAKYGQALSGIIEAKLKEGTEVPRILRYATDRRRQERRSVRLPDLGAPPLCPAWRDAGAEDEKMRFFMTSPDLSNAGSPRSATFRGKLSLVQGTRFRKPFRYGTLLPPREQRLARVTRAGGRRRQVRSQHTKRLGSTRGSTGDIVTSTPRTTVEGRRWTTTTRRRIRTLLSGTGGDAGSGSAALTRFFTSEHRCPGQGVTRTNANGHRRSRGQRLISGTSGLSDYRDRFVEDHSSP
jgi:hypothetical protein